MSVTARLSAFFHSLIGRILLSQVIVGLVVFAITLSALAIGLRPVQRELIYRRLADSQLPAVLFMRNARPGVGVRLGQANPQGAARTSDSFIQDRLIAVLDQQARTQNLRALLLTGDASHVVYDTAGALTGGASWRPDAIRFLDRQSPRPANAPADVPNLTRGVAHIQGERWLVVGSKLINDRFAEPVSYTLLVLAPEPSTWNAVREIMQAVPLFPLSLVVLGLMLVVGQLSLWLSRSVARGLDAVVAGAQEIAAGNLDYRAPVDASTPTEFRTLAENFNHMAEEIQRSRQAQRDFVANVSHDLRTPLTSIHGFSQALLDGTAQEPEARQRAIQIIHDEASRVVSLVNELVELARLDSGRLQLKQEPVDLNQHLRWLLDTYQARCQEKGVDLRWQPSPSPAVVLGDPDRLTRIFGNLLDNSLKFTPSGGSITVSVQPAAEGQAWEVSITDTGPGIPAADLPRLFDRFYQVDKARTGKKGSGLGLAIVKELVAAHGGQVGVESVQGLGSRFWVRLGRRGDDSTRR